ncbi:MAG: fibrillarin-like rRNA/tRNA 2'-O-methyltransferase [Candidatus Aenigmarchaeota archaeon]|nr:fibrillarin-like rRNA/tRNA 2'-O-methyltransferase [Candidatus Aenigmarchaeota archaeon]
MKIKEIFPGVFRIGDDLFTKNLVPGEKVYGERLVKINGVEYRFWDPFRSKPASAIKKGLKTFPLEEDSNILYLGAATGTTISHFSDIAKNGVIYAVEISEVPYRKLMDLSKKRFNIVPILADARKEKEYSDFIFGKVNVVYCDISQPDEVEIFIRNCEKYLKDDGYGMVAVKSRSIDVVKDPMEIYREAEKKIKAVGYEHLETVKLDPFEKDHAIIVCKKTK